MRNLSRREDEALLKIVNKGRGSNDKIVGFIYETENYKQFKKLLGNRDIDENNKSRIEQSMKVKRLPIPGIVNEFNEVIDGQTREIVVEENEWPFLYIVAPGMDINDCLLANTNSKNWNLKDILNRYAKNGNENYVRFLSLMNEFKISESLVMNSSSVYFHQKQKRDSVKEGGLIFTEEDYEKARKTLTAAFEYYRIINRNGKAPKREALLKFFIACEREGCENKTMKKACEKAAIDFVDTQNFHGIAKQIIPLYNERKRTNFMSITENGTRTQLIFNAAGKPAIL